MMNILQPRGFLLLLTVWVSGEGPSYPYESFFPYSRSRSPGLDPADIALRAQNFQYRSIYRNRNYFVPPRLKTTTYTPHRSTLPTSTGKPTSRTKSTTTISYPHGQEEHSDSSILFAGPSTPSSNTYIRTVQSFTSTLEKNKISDEETDGVLEYLPSPHGKSPPSCAKETLYCESFDNYPEELVNEVLSRKFTPKEFQDVYGETTDNTTAVTDLKLLERTSLSSSNYEETPLCSSIERTIYPRVARNKDNQWKYVINHDEYIQGVRVEKCLDDGADCFFGETAPAGYQTACRQKYIYKKLLALTPEGKTSTDTFKLPSCCVCFFRKTMPPFANRIQLVSPATSRKPPEDSHEEPEYDDLPATTTSTTTKNKAHRGYRG